MMPSKTGLAYWRSLGGAWERHVEVVLFTCGSLSLATVILGAWYRQLGKTTTLTWRCSCLMSSSMKLQPRAKRRSVLFCC